MKSAYGRVLGKYNWAEKHVKNFEVACEEFRKANSDPVVREEDGQTGEVIFRVSHVPVLPDDLSLLMGDAMQNLRSTLDYLACELVAVAGNLPNTQTAFPVFDTADEYWERMARKVKGMRQTAIEAINRRQPYQGG